MSRRFLLLAVIVTLAGAMQLDTSTLFRSDPWEYYTDYSDYREGCRVVKCSEVRPERDPRMLTGWEEDGETHLKAALVFADENPQDSFTLDLGRLRPVGKVYITTSLQDEPRIPTELSIHGSTQGPDGPWTTLLENGDMHCRFTYMFDAAPVRWLRFDLGENTNGLGSRIKRLEIYLSLIHI